MKKIIVLCLVALFSIGLVEAQTPKKGGKNLTTTVFMTNLDCQGCAKKITDNIPLAKGVEDVKVDVDTKTVTVTFDAAKTNNEALVKAFAKIKIKAEAGCCGDCTAKTEKKECTDDCCSGHDHGHEHNHGHDHGHSHDHGHNHAH